MSLRLALLTARSLSSTSLVKETPQLASSDEPDRSIDVKSTFTPELINSLMESSRPEAEANLKNSFAISTLAKEEGIEIDKETLEKKLKEVNLELSGEKNIDQGKLRQAVLDDLLQEKVFDWLEANNTVIEKTPVESKTKTDKTKKNQPKK